jgi:hypothetical protein
MKTAILCIAFLGFHFSELRTLAFFHQEVIRIERGEYSDHVDDNIESRIETDL